MTCAVESFTFASEGTEAEREFTLKVLPLLKQKCLGCHGGDPSDIKGEYSVLDREQLLRGGESGELAVSPGNPEKGTLLPALRWEELEMPPKENDRLSSEQIATVERWIKAGAPWPDEKTQELIRENASQQIVNSDGVMVGTSGGASSEWTNRRYQPEDLWAFQPVPAYTDDRQHSVINDAGLPVDQDHLSSQVIDALILRELQKQNLAPAPRAEARTLIRRATFDLHGLPPTPEEVDEFVEASRKDPQEAWRSLIDRLLASPRYGEHWARHWLDVTRYADTGGMSNDYERSNMWRYRDYVIRAFNEDKSYQDFIVEQIAGDELADQSVRERKGGTEQEIHRTQLSGDYTDQEAEWIIATGFLRLGPWDNAMVDKAEARQMWLDDLVNITGQTFLSTTMRCVKCHDHKFDPIPTRDYYQMYAAFSTTHMAERPVPLLEKENLAGFEAGRAHVQRLLEYAVQEKNKLINKRETAARKWFEEHNLPYQD
ncbi:MAG: DUF1549 domain-containing protein, partial [Planctomycetaceae bacterium]|nr:DUF1549 domain-containing protein [Planctomycetaceae bacterium]